MGIFCISVLFIKKYHIKVRLMWQLSKQGAFIEHLQASLPLFLKTLSLPTQSNTGNPIQHRDVFGGNYQEGT
jgi:hypothetical protein